MTNQRKSALQDDILWVLRRMLMKELGAEGTKWDDVPERERLLMYYGWVLAFTRLSEEREIDLNGDLRVLFCELNDAYRWFDGELTMGDVLATRFSTN